LFFHPSYSLQDSLLVFAAKCKAYLYRALYLRSSGGLGGGCPPGGGSSGLGGGCSGGGGGGLGGNP
jgi:hypothetical protein